MTRNHRSLEDVFPSESVFEKYVDKTRTLDSGQSQSGV